MRSWRAARSSLIYNFRQGGVTHILGKTIRKLLDWAGSEEAWLVYRRDCDSIAGQDSPLLVHREIDFDTLCEHKYLKALALPESIRQRFASGASCHGFFLDGHMVNVAWTTQRQLELEPGLSIDDPKATGIFDCFTPPEHRSRGYYTQSLVQLMQILKENGSASALICVALDNPASIKGIERAGFQPLYCMRRKRRFGRNSIHKTPFELNQRAG